MIRRIFSTVLVSILLLSPQASYAWWDFGHRIVVEVAKRHLDPKVLKELNGLLGHDLSEDASWMDDHRSDPELSYAYYWHNCGFIEGTDRINAEYGFNGGGALTGLISIEENLRHYSSLSPDNRKILIRMAIHFMGDIHCPAHIFYESHVQKWKFIIPEEKEPISFHAYYDTFPERMFGPISPAEAAASIDTGKDMKKACRGTVRDWVFDCGRTTLKVIEINPLPQDRYSVYAPAPDTYERSLPIIERQLTFAGYRLAHLLNESLAQIK